MKFESSFANNLNSAFESLNIKGIPCNSKKMKVMLQPDEFYNMLIEQAAHAEKRIILSSLYLGTGQLEEKLVSTVHDSLQKHPNLKVQWFLDKGRGCRSVKGKSSLGMLVPTTLDFKNRHNAYFYTPILSENLITQFLPPRWNEILSVYHIKCYVFDNNMIISGANLSNDYFTTRIDRYVLFEDCPNLVNFYEQFFSILLHYCSYVSPVDGKVVPFVSNYKIMKQFRDQVLDLLANADDDTNADSDSNADVMIYPAFQQEVIDLITDYDCFKQCLQSASHYDLDLYLTSGYVNFPYDVTKLLATNKNTMHYLFAAPQANSFFHDPGFASVIPACYNVLQCNFFHACCDNHADAHFLEYLNKNWTYHSKGLWLFLHDSTAALVTIGSPNFGMRSYFRDMESQLYMLSESEYFRKIFEVEVNHRFHNKDVVEVSSELYDAPERAPPNCPVRDSKMQLFLKMAQSLL